MGKYNSNLKKDSLYSKEELVKLLNLSRKKKLLLSVKNKNTNEYGVASYTKDDKVAVFEGRENGKDDKIYSVNYFMKNYILMKDSINIKKLKQEEFEM